ncbi:MAG: CRISPR-associated endonuclease Cas2 [Methanobrevibacter sp.]|nr:CRISPR-associated endonuclease Cas2 [Methanobrevibacter sp.]
MHIITSFDCKSKTNRKNIEKILQHFALRKIQSSLYAGKLEKNELELLMKKLMKS